MCAILEDDIEQVALNTVCILMAKCPDCGMVSHEKRINSLQSIPEYRNCPGCGREIRMGKSGMIRQLIVRYER